jgi:predicted ATPase with chaperone activity
MATVPIVLRGAGEQGFIPPVPGSIKETGLNSTFLEQLILNHLYRRGELNGRMIADAVGLDFRVIESILEDFKFRQIIEVKGSLGYGMVSSTFALTETGRKRSRESAVVNQYCGPAPVPIYQYAAVVESQRPKKGWITRERLIEAYRHMVMTDRALSQIGPAVNSSRSFLVYGEPGNGKTYLAEALADIDPSPIYIPYAIEHNGLIIQVFDPLIHRPIERGDRNIGLVGHQRASDGRWVLCRRPFVVTGGELSLEMLELSYNENVKLYDAPCHLKANNGIYLIDDFGRQKVSPADVLNRWIVPMESRVDHLRLPTGGKVTVPFEVFLIFSTNLSPQGLGDEAFLRRIQYKMFVQNPDVREFVLIFRGLCVEKNLACDVDMLDRFLERRYLSTAKQFRRCHPRDLISHALDLMEFERLPRQLTDDILDRAYESCFVE